MYLRCPDCALTVPATAYYLRGDECPRCLTAMERCERFRSEARGAPAAIKAAAGLAAQRPGMRPAASA